VHSCGLRPVRFVCPRPVVKAFRGRGTRCWPRGPQWPPAWRSPLAERARVISHDDRNLEALGLDCACGCDRERTGPMGNTSSGMPVQERHTLCYPLAYEYVRSLERDDALLVHGTIGLQADPTDADIGHAWVVEADGWVWEPTNDAWFHSEEAYAASLMHGRPAQTWSPSEARELLSKGGIGEWSPDRQP
jgi:hypothetical protein